MSRLVLSAASLVLVASLLLAGCSQAGPQPAPTTAPAAPAPGAAPTKAPEPAKPTAAPAAPTAAQAAYPEKGKAITLIVPWDAGTGPDVGARLLATLVEKELGTNVTVANKAGAGSQVGITELVKSKPDGYTVGISTLPTAALLYLDPARKAAFGRKDFQLLANYGHAPQMMAVPSNSPFKTMKDLVDSAKANPKGVTVADSGLMTVTHMATMSVESAAGVQFSSVHFSGGDALPALLGGHVQVSASAITNVISQLKSKEIRVLGIMAKQRDPLYPDIPTMEEQGIKAELSTMHGFVTVQGVPPAVVDAWSTAIKKSLANPDVAKKLSDATGLTPNFLDPVQFAATWDNMERYIKDALARGSS